MYLVLSFERRLVRSSERGKGATIEVCPCLATDLCGACYASAIETLSYVVMPNPVYGVLRR